MIQMQTRLNVADNTGAKEVMCFKVLGGSRKRYAGLGDIVVCSVKSVIAGSEIKKKAVVQGVIVRCKQVDPPHRRQLRPVRQQRRGADRRRKESPRHAHFRRRGARIARSQFYENRQSGQRSGVSERLPCIFDPTTSCEIITGEDVGIRGKVLKVMPNKRQARRRRREPRLQAHEAQPEEPARGPVSKEMPIDVSNVHAGRSAIRQADPRRRAH